MNNILSTTELAHIEEDMTVVDVNDDKIGTVEYVRFGDEDYTEEGPETVSGYEREGASENTFVDMIAEVFNPDDIPEPVKARMYRHGFLKVETGLFKDDRYVLLDEVARINDDTVHLTITKDDLFHL